MNDSESPLIAVGRNCPCGFPLVWRGGQRWCAVYGAHPAPSEPVTFRNRHAPGARLVDELTAMKYRHLKAVS